MCKTWAIVHSCGHTINFRLSTCRGSYTHTTRKSKSPATLCRGSPTWGVRSESRCGSCHKADEEQRLEAEIAQLRAELADAEDWLMDAEQGYASELWKLNSEYPDCRFKKLKRPETRVQPTRNSSGLRNEVKIEDLSEAPPLLTRPSLLSTPSWERQWNWAEGWASFEDNDSTDDEDAGVPALTSTDYEALDWKHSERIDSEPILIEPESPPALKEPESPPTLPEAMYLSHEDISMMDCALDPEEDLFTFPEERFLAISAPVEEHALHAVSYADANPSGKRAPSSTQERRKKRVTLASQMSSGLRSLQNYGARWPMESSMSG